MRRWQWITLALAVLIGLPAVYLSYADDEVPPPKPPTLDSEAVITGIDAIEPGTVIGDGPPEGWTHLVIKSIPRVPPEERGKVMGFMARMAELVSTVTLAEVGSEGTGGGRGYFLKRVAVGMGVKIDGKDTVVTPETASDLGADVGTLSRMLMKKIAAHQRAVRLVAATRTTALIDTPAFAARPDGHRKIIIRYYYRVDPGDGGLDVLAWLIDLDDGGNYLRAEGPIEWLPDGLISDAVMRIDTETLDALGIPEDETFAILRIPQGEREIRPGPDVTALWAAPRPTLDEYVRLKDALDEAMDSARGEGTTP